MKEKKLATECRTQNVERWTSEIKPNAEFIFQIHGTTKMENRVANQQKKTFIINALCCNKRTRSFNILQTNHSNYYYCWNVHTLWISYQLIIQIWIFQADESQWDWDPMRPTFSIRFVALRNSNRGKISSIFMYVQHICETSKNILFSFGDWLNI